MWIIESTTWLWAARISHSLSAQKKTPRYSVCSCAEKVSPRHHHRNGFSKVDQGLQLPRAGTWCTPWAVRSVVIPMPPSPGDDGLGHARRYRPSPRNWDGTSELWPQSFGNTLADGCGNGCLPGETSRLFWWRKMGIMQKPAVWKGMPPWKPCTRRNSHHISPLKIISRGFLIENCWNSWGRCKLQHSHPGHFLLQKYKGWPCKRPKQPRMFGRTFGKSCLRNDGFYL